MFIHKSLVNYSVQRNGFYRFDRSETDEKGKRVPVSNNMKRKFFVCKNPISLSRVNYFYCSFQ